MVILRGPPPLRITIWITIRLTYHMVKTGFGRTPLYYIFIFGGKFGGKFEICRTHTSHTENLSEITKH